MEFLCLMSSLVSVRLFVCCFYLCVLLFVYFMHLGSMFIVCCSVYFVPAMLILSGVIETNLCSGVFASPLLVGSKCFTFFYETDI